jgi:hypothetical protein
MLVEHHHSNNKLLHLTLPVVKKEKKEMQVVPDPVNEKHSSSHRHNAHSILSASGHSTRHRSAESKKYISIL